MQSTQIDWNYEGKPDALVGTGATVAERMLGYGSAAAFTLLLVGWQVFAADPGATGWRLLVYAVLAFDVAGGVTANMLNSCKRFYHADIKKDERGFTRLLKNPLMFALLHVHPLLIALLFEGNLPAAAIWYAALVGSVAITLSAPLYLRRPTATGLVVAAILISLYALPIARGFEWFVPCLFFKIVLGHTVREEPYRPAL